MQILKYFWPVTYHIWKRDPPKKIQCSNIYPQAIILIPVMWLRVRLNQSCLLSVKWFEIEKKVKTKLSVLIKGIMCVDMLCDALNNLIIIMQLTESNPLYQTVGAAESSKFPSWVAEIASKHSLRSSFFVSYFLRDGYYRRTMELHLNAIQIWIIKECSSSICYCWEWRK